MKPSNTITLAEFNKLQDRHHKYGAHRAQSRFPALQSRSFASQLERDCAEWLYARQLQGDIRNLEFQQVEHLTDADISWAVDFRCEELMEVGECKLDGNGDPLQMKVWGKVWYEAKGFEQPDYRIKLKLWRVYGPGLLYVVKHAARGGLRIDEVVWPKGKE